MGVMTRFVGMLLAGAFVVGVGAGIVRTQEVKSEAKKERARIYDPKADADVLVAAAVAQARKDNQRVLVMFGGDWCVWCHRLHGLFETNPEVRKLLNDEYVLVPIDLESPSADRLLRDCKAALVASGDDHAVGYPFLAVLDADRKIVTAQRTNPLEEGDHHDPKKVGEFLARWKAEPLDAARVLDSALVRAGEQDKRVLLHFGAPWCGWCHRLDDFLAQKDIAAILGRDFIDVKVDIDRMTGGKTVQKKYRGDDSGGIPWLAILDPKGNVLVTSDGPSGNIGYPAKSDEIDHFVSMLRKTARQIEPGQIDQIARALRDAADRLKIAG